MQESIFNGTRLRGNMTYVWEIKINDKNYRIVAYSIKAENIGWNGIGNFPKK